MTLRMPVRLMRAVSPAEISGAGALVFGGGCLAGRRGGTGRLYIFLDDAAAGAGAFEAR